MAEQIYVVKRPFASLRHNGMEKEGDTIPLNDLSEGSAKRMIKKGLISLSYSTKEDKRAAKIQKKKHTIKKDTSQWYFIMKGEEVVDRVWQKKKAQEVADELNES